MLWSFLRCITYGMIVYRHTQVYHLPPQMIKPPYAICLMNILSVSYFFIYKDKEYREYQCYSKIHMQLGFIFILS